MSNLKLHFLWLNFLSPHFSLQKYTSTIHLPLTMPSSKMILYHLTLCSSFDLRFGIFGVIFLWCIHNIHTASVSIRGSLFSSGGMVGFEYVMVLGGKCMMTCVSSSIVLYGVSFVVHSSFGMVRIVIVSWFSFAARRAQCMAFCVFSLLCGWA
jgi:hypothetical protein